MANCQPYGRADEATFDFGYINVLYNLSGAVVQSGTLKEKATRSI